MTKVEIPERFTERSLLQRASAVPMVPLIMPTLERKGIQLMVRRDDLIDTRMSGNKLYKLFYNIGKAHALGIRQVASFGGAWSNHLYALAAAGQEFGMATVGVIRGERPALLSDTLRDAEAMGMQLCFVDRDTYRQLTREPVRADYFSGWLKARYGELLLIPEGGANREGAQGAVALGQAIEQGLQGEYDQVCIAAGTGTTLAGLAAGLPPGKIACGISVLKGHGSMPVNIARFYDALQHRAGVPRQHHSSRWRLISGFHGGGYARKLSPALVAFQAAFEDRYGFLLDPVYTLKLFFAVVQLATADYWPRGTRLVVVHSGGLQGRRGFSLSMTQTINKHQ